MMLIGSRRAAPVDIKKFRHETETIQRYGALIRYRKPCMKGGQQVENQANTWNNEKGPAGKTERRR